MPPGIRPRLSTKSSNELEIAPPKSTKTKKIVIIFAIVVIGLILFSAFSSADVVVVWTAPTNYTGGEVMPLSDVGGYEIRYRKTSDLATVADTVVLIPDGKAVTWTLPIVLTKPTSYTVSIADYDIHGVYSDFVVVPYVPLGKPQAPTAVTVTLKPIDVKSACTATVNCRVAVPGEWK